MSRKLLFLGLTICLSAVFLLGVYLFAFKKGPIFGKTGEDQKQVKKMETGDVLGSSIRQKMMEISPGEVISPTQAGNKEKIIYFDPDERAIVTADEIGKNRKYEKPVIAGKLLEVNWAPNRESFILKVEAGKSFEWYYYESVKTKGKKLPEGIDNLAWDVSGENIIIKQYLGDKKSRIMAIAKPDGSGMQKLFDVPFSKIKIVTIPKSGNFGVWLDDFSREKNPLWTFNPATKEPILFFEGRKGADYLWSPDGKSVLVSYVEDNKMRLGLLKKGEEFRDIFFASIVSKCAWSYDSSALYCAAPGIIPDSQNLIQDYLDGKFNTQDTFWRIELPSNKKTRLVEPEELGQKIDAKDVFFSPSKNSLYFTNRITGRLMRLEI